MKKNFLKLFAKLIVLLFVLNILICSYNAASAQNTVSLEKQSLISNQDILVLNINMYRIITQLDILLNKLGAGDKSLLFEHAYIPHSVILPSIKNIAIDFDKNFTQTLENRLANIPFQITSKQDPIIIKNEVIETKNLVNNMITEIKNSISKQNYFALESQTLSYLLRDSESSFGLYKNSSGVNSNSVNLGLVDLENAQGLVNQSTLIFNILKSQMNETKSKEMELFFKNLNAIILSKNSSINEYSKLVLSIEKDLNQLNYLSNATKTTNTVNPSLQPYYDKINILMANAIAYIKNNNDYINAEKNASSAYLDNYEFLEAPIEKANATLMAEIEIDMRENLRNLIKNEVPLAQIENLISKIQNNLEISKQLLIQGNSELPGDADAVSSSLPLSSTNASPFAPNLANIDSLKQGFGVYTGERKSMGDTSEDFKTQVRSNIDNIQIKLDEVIKYYSKNNPSQALATARSAYLDSYESIEIPLRPINPDFTLEMEIKFAELRNLLSSNSPLGAVVLKISEIKKGLDESERFVSGTGVVAPAITFSSSFSIIFREGLESALILGAILTYLEASRSDKYKKHVYLGIILAIGLTAITWYIAEYFIDVSGAERELIEAVAGISAVAILFWVSFWVLNKVETKKWIEFVKAKVWQATATGSVMVFVMLSFFTVYREGFETVLFYQALFSFAKYMEFYALAGLVSGLCVIIGVVFIIRKLGKKLPLRVLFGLTMGVGAFMSITFLGNAIRDFQELGYISTTHLFGIIPRLDINVATMTGIHPTLETVLAQIILLSIYILGSAYILFIQPKKQKTIAAMRKSVANKNREGHSHNLS